MQCNMAPHVKAQLCVHVDATQASRRRFDAVVNLFWLCVVVIASGPIAALAAASSPCKVAIFCEAHVRPFATDAWRVRKDVTGL